MHWTSPADRTSNPEALFLVLQRPSRGVQAGSEEHFPRLRPVRRFSRTMMLNFIGKKKGDPADTGPNVGSSTPPALRQMFCGNRMWVYMPAGGMLLGKLGRAQWRRYTKTSGRIAFCRAATTSQPIRLHVFDLVAGMHRPGRVQFHVSASASCCVLFVGAARRQRSSEPML